MVTNKKPQHINESKHPSHTSVSEPGDDDESQSSSNSSSLLYYPYIRSHPSPFASSSSHFSRQRALARYEDLPIEKFESPSSAVSVFFFVIKLTAPLAYTYIVLCVVRDILMKTDTLVFVNDNLPFVRWVLTRCVDDNPMFLHVWAILEAIFHILLTLQMHWLQNFDPLELSLQTTQIMSIEERALFWKRIMESESNDPVSFLTEWFFGCELGHIDRSDVVDFLAWSLFEGRNVEHLTAQEVKQLDHFVHGLEYSLSVHLYGYAMDFDGEEKKISESTEGEEINNGGDVVSSFEEAVLKKGKNSLEQEDKEEITSDVSTWFRKRPARNFRFSDHIALDTPHWAFFSNLYENYKHMSENYLNFHVLPSNTQVQDVRNYVTKKH